MIFQNQLVKSLKSNSQKTAIEHEGKTTSYSELLQKANKITQHLLAQQLDKETIIGIDLKDRSDIIAAVIGVANARCVFVLLDRSLPDSRMEHLISDLNLQYLISDKGLHISLASAGLKGSWQYEEIQQLDQPEILNYPEFEGDDSLYVYFTSGTTGTPKGIVGRNCSLLQFLYWEINAFDLSEDSRFSQFISPYFDAFLRDVFAPLLAGGTICIPPDEEDFFSPDKIIPWINDSQITAVHCVPSLFRQINTDAVNASHFQSLRHVLMSGEKINPSELVNWYETFDNRIQLVNLYGATEATMIRSFYNIQPGDVKRSRMPIGNPIADTQLLITKKNMQPCPALVPGQLYIISNYLTKGYLNRPELTAERFIKLHEGTPEETMAYMTGDKARKLAAGQIELLGREDRQVKLRGIRIELDEVEMVLMNSGLLSNAVVVLHTDDQEQDSLVAFIINKEETSEKAEVKSQLAAYLKANVPGYMIPANLVLVDEYPLLHNGKINLKGLLSNLTLEREIVLPVNKTEERILAIWKEILGDKSISTEDSFHQIGGNSLSLMGLIARINKEFQIRISLSELFKNPTICKQAAFVIGVKGHEEENAAIPAAEKADHYTLSSAQKRLFFLYRFEPGSLAYNMPNVFRLEGELDKNHIQNVFEQLIARHESLRTSFELLDGEPVQRVSAQVELAIEYFTASEEEAPAIVQSFIRPFDLSAPSLIRVGLIKTALNQHQLMVDIHHIVSDGISQEILIKEFMALYNNEALAALKISYKDFAVWQQDQAQQERVVKQGEFWKEAFAEEVEALDLPTDFARPAIKSNAGSTLSFEIDREETARLQAIADGEEATMFMVLLAAYNILMVKLTNQEDIVVGSPIAGRHLPDLENMFGMFVNTLSLRNRPKGGLTYKAFLSMLKSNTLTCLENQDYPYEELIEALKVERDTSRNPLFDVMFSYQNYQESQLEIPDFTLSQLAQEQTISKFDLTLFVFEKGGRLKLDIEYATALFKRETIEKFVGYFRKVVSAITANINTKISDIEIVSDDEKARLLEDFNNTSLDFDKDSTIDSLFQKVVHAHGDRTALVFKDKQLSYAELNERSDQLAHRIRKAVGAEDKFIGLLMERSPELIVSMLAVLKAGLAYVPIDPEYPFVRIEHIVQDSQLGVILMSPAIGEICQKLPEKLTLIDVTSEVLSAEPKNPLNQSSATDLAYLIYTSGSTGLPKGVMVTHRNVINFTHGILYRIALEDADSILSLTTASFDIFVLESILPLLNGLKIVLASTEEQKDTKALYRLIKGQKTDAIQITPSHLKLLLAGSNSDVLADVKILMVGGEAFPDQLLHDLHAGYSGKLFNMYGPTETTVWSTIRELNHANSINIGSPIANTIIRILDVHGGLLPVGIAGDLYIGGEGVSQGYWGNPQLTETRFIQDPLGSPVTIYQTGDRARWLADGNIEYLGRNDNQIKINGYRIELGEIESQLAAHDQITEVSVVVKDRGENKFLTAYYLSDDIQTLASLRTFLEEKLPVYMLPSFYVHLESFPLTPNGKLDKNALPDPEIEIGEDLAAPSNEMEEKLITLWSETLEIPQEAIGVNSSFFELGGHSILAIKLISLIQEHFGVNLGLPAFFKDPSIRAIAQKLQEGSGEKEVLPEMVADLENRFEPFVLTDVQQAYLIGRKDIFEHGQVGTHMYSESFMEALDIDAFNHVLQRLIARHEMLRAIITPDGHQRILREVPAYEVKVLDLNEWSEEEGTAQFQAQRDELSHQVFSGEEWPLFDIRVTKFRDETYKVHYSVDAMMIDAGSGIILGNEFRELSLDQHKELPPIAVSFRDYVKSLEILEQGSLFETSRQYWTARVEDMPFAPDLPIVAPEFQAEKPKFERHAGQVKKGHWDALQNKVKGLGITPTVFLIGCFAEVLNRWSKSSHFSLNLTLFNRIPFHKEVDKLVGDFTSLTLLEVDFREVEAFSARLKNIQDRLWEDLEHKYFSGVEMQREMSRFHGHSVIIPVVITSTLGLGDDQEEGGTDELPDNLEEIQKPYSITQTPQVWLDFQLGENKDGLWFIWDSVEELFPEALIDHMFEAFNQLLSALVADESIWHNQSLVTMPATQVGARETVNKTQSPQSEKYLHELFIDQVGQAPDRLAVITAEKQFTYGEVHTMSLALGRKIRDLGAKPNRLVAIVMEKCWEQVVASFAIQYAGGAYLPIGSELPESRIMMLLEQGEVDIVVTTQTVADRLSFEADKSVVLVEESLKDEQDLSPMEPVQQPSDLAYVIFTSGSSGTPKGVMIDHIGAVNTVIDINERFDVGPDDRVLAISSLSFDLSVYDIFGLLAVGGALVIPGQDELRSPDRWIDYILENKVTLWNTVPALMQMLVDHNREREQIPLRVIMMSGDWIPLNLPGRIKAIAQDADVYSLGGATEASIWSIYYPINDIDRQWKSVPYGKPLKNQGFHVLKPDLSHCPDYVPGDLYITGIGLAKGYWKDEKKTNSSFITHPETGQRLYKTGDLGRYLADGNIEFLGREDNQVKIQGFRIELGEIEHQLTNHPEVKEAAVLAKDNLGEKYLVAYYQADDEIDAEAFDHYLQEVLPAYMIPSYYMHLEAFPLTPNGKVSVKLLPEPEVKARLDYVAPENETQEKLIDLWSQLLGIEAEVVGINRSFFELGGHSLKAMEMINRIREELDVEVPLKVVFEKRDVKQISEYIQKAEHSDFLMIEKAAPKPYYTVSSAQKRLFFLYKFDTTSLAYNMPSVFKLEGELEKDHIQKVFEQLIARHEPLRTSFEFVDGELVQRIMAQVDFEIEYFTASEEEAPAIVQSFIRPFDLSTPLLMRVGLIETGPDHHHLMVDIHHIVIDGISQEILIKEFMALYNNEALPALKISYKDFAVWQQGEEQQEKVVRQANFWKEVFSEEVEALDLPTDFVRPAIKSNAGSVLSFEINQEQTARLKAIADGEEATMFMVMLAVYNTLLAKLTNKEDIIVGNTIAGRHWPDLENMFGMFVNTLSLRNQPKGELTFKAFLSMLKSNTLTCLENQDYPYEELIEDLQVERDTSRNPLFDVMFSYQNYQETKLEIPDLTLSQLPNYQAISKFDLTLFVFEKEGRLKLDVEYASELFKEETIQRFISNFEQIVSAVIRDVNTPLKDIEILTKQEKEQLQVTFNDTKRPYPDEETIVSLFEKQVLANPDHPALFFEASAVNYGQLKRQSDQIANYLIQVKHVKTGDRLGVMLEREAWLIPVIFGVLKAGGVYVPIDPNFPTERINTIIEASGLKALMTRGRYASEVATPALLVDLDHAEQEILSQPATAPEANLDSHDLAYIIYTSGSTGKPKGVMVEHHSVVNRILWMQKEYPITESDTLLQKTPIIFDVSVWELFWWSFTGASLCLLKPGAEKEPGEIIKAIEQHKVTTMHFVPSMLSVFLSVTQKDLGIEGLGSLRQVFASGEALKAEHVQQFGQLIHQRWGTRLINLYGPTEATVDVSYYECDFNDATTTPPIGQPIDNTTLHVLSKDQRLLPVGVPGELHIGGVGLARGYWGDPVQTQEKFITNPLTGEGRLYKTGDLAKWLPDGNLAYLGRIDHQVKIRGFRIELGEIESNLLAHDPIEEAVVVVKEKEADKFLVAYYRSDEVQAPDTLRAFLEEQLPGYMIPAFFVHLESFPLTPNGKLNTKALPAPEADQTEDMVAPQSEEEALLLKIWTDVLKVDNISTTDNFFTIGGDSIKSILICSRARTMGYSLSIEDVITHRTVQNVARKLEKLETNSSQEEVSGTAPLTPIQKWFMAGPIKNKNRFNQSVMLDFKADVSHETIGKIFDKILAHHDVLRSVFKEENNEWEQQITEKNAPLAFEEHDLRGMDDWEAQLSSLSDNIQTSLDVGKGPVLKLGLFKMDAGDRLLIVIHHLVVDGVSWRILFEDIDSLYLQAKANEALSLPAKTDAYHAWAKHLLGYVKTKEFEHANDYWNQAFSAKPNQLKRDFPEGTRTYDQSRVPSFTLSKEYTSKLMSEVNDSFHTQINDILLAALVMSIHEQFDQHNVQIDLEGHGRENIHQGENVNRTVGWFTSIYPVLLSHHEGEWSQTIKQVKESLRNVPNHGIDYLLKRYLVDDNDSETADQSSPIIFNYLGQFDSDINDKSFEVTREFTGDSIAPDEQTSHDWDISGMVTGGMLKMTLSYSEGQYREETIISFMSAYEQHLVKLIDYCSNYGKDEFTPSDFTYKGLSIAEVDELNEQYDLSDLYPLSPMQEGMLFHSLFDSESEFYFEQFTHSVKGQLDAAALEHSMNALMARHDILRTIFLHEGFERPIQLILDERKIDFQFIDAKEDCQKRSKSAVRRDYQNRQRARKFNLSSDVLVRLLVVQMDDDEYELIWGYHHILMDGWCMSIITSELKSLYVAHKKGVELSLPETEPFSKYIAWIEKRDKKESLNYWQNYLEGYQNSVSLPKIEQLPNQDQPYELRSEELKIDKELTAALQAASGKYGVTVNTIVQCAWGMLLGRYGNFDDVVFGSVVSGRPAELTGMERVVGLFINTIPVRVKMDAEASIEDLLTKTQKSALTGDQYHYNPLSEIQALSEMGSDLINCVMVFENYPIADEIMDTNSDDSSLDDFTITNVELYEPTNYDLLIFVNPGEEMLFKVDFNANVHAPEMVEKAVGHFGNIIGQMAGNMNGLLEDVTFENSQIPLARIELAGVAERNRLLFQLNGPKRNFDREKVYSELFREQVEKTPDRIAVAHNGDTLTYQQLHDKSIKLARYLVSKGIGNENKVALFMSRGIDMLVSILASLKAGSSYVPIDIDYPGIRVEEIIKDSEAHMVITKAAHRADLNEIFNSTPTLESVLDIDTLPLISRTNGSAPTFSGSTNDLAYIIYTSGTTGKPKGVMIHQLGMINHLYAKINDLNIGADDVIAQTASPCFDISVWQFLAALMVGGKTCIIDKEKVVYPDSLCDELQKGKVSIFESVPSLMTSFLDDLPSDHDLSLKDLRWMVPTGEALSVALTKKWYEHFPEIKLLNAYGPTEASDDVTHYVVPKPTGDEDTIPIGQPMANTQILILNPHLGLCPVGVRGEICVAGLGVGRGYWGKEELTNAAFVTNPFLTELDDPDYALLYKTGDIGYYREDGNVVYIGRKDDQLKINGNRVELGEIESHLSTYEGISEAVANVKEKGEDHYLIGYYLSEETIEVNELIAHLQTRMPEYMVPNFYMRLDKFPLTQNGKLDRKALPDPEISGEETFIAPSTEAEKQLAVMWAEILNVDLEVIGVNRSFFELGGHSLKSISLVNMIAKAFGVKVLLKDVFTHQNIRNLAELITQSAGLQYQAIKKAETKPYYPLSQAQLPLFFQHEVNPDSLERNQTFIGVIEGDLDKEKLEQVFQKLFARHDSLRTSFKMNDLEPVQVVAEKVDFEISQFEAEESNARAVINEFVRPFDIGKAPLMRVGLATLEPQRHGLMVDIHHLVADGLSLEILTDEFLALYNSTELPATEAQYTDFVSWEESEEYQESMADQKQFWVNEFSKEIQPLEVPIDYEQPDSEESEGERIALELDSEKVQLLRQLAEKQGATLSMVMLAFYNILLSKLTRQEDIIVGVPLNGRERAEFEKTVGMFAKVLPVRNYPKAQLTFDEFLAEVKHKFSSALDHQTYPYEELARELGIERNTGRNPWFDVMFTYTHQRSTDGHIEGLIINQFAGKEVLIRQNMGLDIAESEDGLLLLFGYSRALFRRETMDKFIEYFKQITDAVLENPACLISQIDIVEGEERRKLLFEFNGPIRTFNREKTYSTLFKEQAEKSPESVAVIHNGTSLSYEQLHEKSIHLATYLVSKGVSSQTKVGIYMPRGIDMLVSILGILQAGSAYVPIDIYYPEKRIDEIVKDSELSIVITKAVPQSDFDAIFDSTRTLETVLDIDTLPLIKGSNGSVPSFSGTTNDLAYMIFTSGTTGKPKGVMIHQLGMINHLYAKINDLNIGADDVIAQTASPCFDISVWQFLAALMVGGKTYIIDKEKAVYPDSLCEELQHGKVSIFESVPSLMTNFLDDLSADHDVSLKDLRWMVPTGEALSVALTKQWYEYFPDIRLLNAYGPTEASDDVTHYVVPKPTGGEHTIPIGQPLANTRIFILNEHLGLCPVGVRGEICVAGLGVGKGYWRNEEKTNAAFVPNPFLNELDDPDYALLYKTGDIGYFREDGNVVYVGRKDDQLKINGNRVELGEIESRLSLHDSIKEAAVMAKDSGPGKLLVAYYVSDEAIDPSELRLYLINQLPDYMVPAIYKRLDKMPLTANGKLNRKALPEPVITLNEDFTKAETVTEIKLTEIWAEVLKITAEQVSVTTDFFSLGGNSLMSITLVGKIHKQLNVKITLRDFFEKPTVRATAEYIDTVSWLTHETKEDGKGKIEISI
ncbi:MAG: non-ribosomal peptide synthase/polyketide synthase [Roseivirga sp.]|nr:non-ribosomal peptide synthase/polyketide synthase [Roseivirga sp.]